jgi:wyosine [tRNA(Phe)-imidazoG37] synthetase (radical SAM superfamily)
MLTIANHRRDSAGLRYVYPVVSRRAGGVSVGINLNVNNACNWACVYCQVENLTRGAPPAIDLELFERELAGFLDAALTGDFLARNVPAGDRRLVDVAFSGNGEPTSAAEFPEAVLLVRRVLERLGLAGKLPVRLITNGSLLHRRKVQEGIRTLGELAGEVWFKLDRGTPDEIEVINGVPMDVQRVRRNLARCATLATTWVQTCWFALDGAAPDAGAREAYCDLLGTVATGVSGIQLYGLARPSLQPAAPRLQRLAADDLEDFAAEIRRRTGLTVLVSP